MKKILYCSALSVLFLSATSCSEKTAKQGEQRNEAGVLLNDVKSPDGAQSLQTSKTDITFQYKDIDYNSLIIRTPDESLPKVKSEMGDLYMDNSIELTLLRNGQSFYSKKFTKKDFASIIDAAFLKKSILEGMVFNKTTPTGIYYAASVCYPQTDLYIPISICISYDGKMTMRKDEQLEDLYLPEKED